MIVKNSHLLSICFGFPSKNLKIFSILPSPHSRLTRSSNKYITRVVYGCWNENSKEKLKHHSILLSFCERKGKLSSSSQLRGGEKDKEEEDKMIFLVTRKGKIGNCVFLRKEGSQYIFSPLPLSRHSLSWTFYRRRRRCM